MIQKFLIATVIIAPHRLALNSHVIRTGSSSWIDYTSAEARKFWASLFHYDKYQGSTPALFTWNDMNEPSVFSGPEITMPKDLIHANSREHRDIHNLYGMLLVFSVSVHF